jgi:hypothetical protein
MMKTTAFYVEAGAEIGMGHVVRCLNLIKLFKARGHTTDIITNEAGYSYFKQHEISSFDVKDNKVVFGGDVAVVDHMLTDNAYLQAIRTQVKKLVVIVGAGHTITPVTRWVADLVIYQCPIRDDLYDVVPGERVLSGFDQLILHPRYGLPQQYPTERELDFTAYFGGGVNQRIARQIVDEIRTRGYSVEWVGEQGTPWWHSGIFNTLGRSNNFVGTMGMVTYEALNRLVKPFVFSRSKDHVEIADLLGASNLVVSMGGMWDRAKLVEKYVDIIEENMQDEPAAYSVVDGKGAYRVAREILND